MTLHGKLTRAPTPTLSPPHPTPPSSTPTPPLHPPPPPRPSPPPLPPLPTPPHPSLLHPHPHPQTALLHAHPTLHHPRLACPFVSSYIRHCLELGDVTSNFEWLSSKHIRSKQPSSQLIWSVSHFHMASLDMVILRTVLEVRSINHIIAKTWFPVKITCCCTTSAHARAIWRWHRRGNPWLSQLSKVSLNKVSLVAHTLLLANDWLYGI